MLEMAVKKTALDEAWATISAPVLLSTIKHSSPFFPAY
jgi:hypothetical protein